jgi:hypothetical protein
MKLSVFLVSVPSAVHLGRCIIGTGPTRELALEDAFGPRPWPAAVRKQARRAHVEERSYPADRPQLP